VTVQKTGILCLLFLAKVCGRIVGFYSRTQTRLLTKAQAMGWKPSDLQAYKLLRRQQALFNFDMAKKRLKKLRSEQPILVRIKSLWPKKTSK